MPKLHKLEFYSSYSGTPLKRHPSTVDNHDKRTILKVLTVFTFTSILKHPLISGHPDTL